MDSRHSERVRSSQKFGHNIKWYGAWHDQLAHAVYVEAAYCRCDKCLRNPLGQNITYDYMVVATGVELDWDRIKGLKETIGKNGVCTNYSYDYVDKTWEFLKNFKGGNMVSVTSICGWQCSCLVPSSLFCPFWSRVLFHFLENSDFYLSWHTGEVWRSSSKNHVASGTHGKTKWPETEYKRYVHITRISYVCSEKIFRYSLREEKNLWQRELMTDAICSVWSCDSWLF